MSYTASNHTFALCAYKKNPHLEASIRSVLNQTARSNVLISTSTPNDYIESLCDKYHLPMVVNENPTGIGGDWNYAYDAANTEVVTIAHQDDIYEPRYVERIVSHLNTRKSNDIIMLFTDYYELREGKRVTSNKILNIKRIMNAPFLVPGGADSKFVRHRILSFGDPICCPSASFVKKNAGESIFDTEFKNSCDYRTWVRLSNKNGAFVYIPELLMGHRIYAESTTSFNLENNIRKGEDAQVMATFWPKPIAQLINKGYSSSEKSNEL